MYRGLILILDGLGDRPSPALDGRTPLEAAHTPNLDRLVADGSCGLVDPLSPGVPVGTQVGTGVLLGLLRGQLDALSRGPVEAAGVGLAIEPGDVALRCNFATVEPAGERLRIVDRRAGRIAEGTGELAAALERVDLGDGIEATLKPATQHRAALRLSGPGLSAEVTDTDPGTRPDGDWMLPCRPRTPEDPAATRTARALSRFLSIAHERLSEHPVNADRVRRGLSPATGLLTRGAGIARNLESIVNHVGLRAAVVAGDATVLGLGSLFRFTPVRDPRFTTMPDSDLEAKFAAARVALEDHELVYVHVKGSDICSHDLDPVGKQAFLERADGALEGLPEDLVVAVSADHSTDSNTGRHCGDPVPSILSWPRGRRDDRRTFGEATCIGGGLGRLRAQELLVTVLDAMGRLGNVRTADLRFLGLA